MSHLPEIPGDPRQIAKWAERYARSRTLPFLVQWVFIVVLVILIGTLADVTFRAYQAHRPILLKICMAAIAIATVALTWFSASKWGSGLIWRISQRLYGKEGYAEYSGGGRSQAMRSAWWIRLVALGLAIYHLVLALLVGMRYLSVEHLQPWSALYMVPFLAVMVVAQRLGFWAWVWPALYALHAVAILAGAPHFRGQWFALDVLVPIFGYGLLSMVIGHFYSRYAFRKLKALARIGSGDDDGGNGGASAE
jgi:hypothetical protein